MNLDTDALKHALIRRDSDPTEVVRGKFIQQLNRTSVLSISEDTSSQNGVSHGLRRTLSRDSSSGCNSSETGAAVIAACQHCCTRKVVLKKCANCRSVQYCSKACQKLDWPIHKKLCELRNPVYFDRDALKRIEWFTYVRKDNQIWQLIESFKIRCLDELKIHRRKMTRAQVVRKFARYIEAARCVVLGNDFKKQEFLRIKQLAINDYDIFVVAERDARRLDAELKRVALASTDWAQLRELHEVICGPIVSPKLASVLNLI